MFVWMRKSLWSDAKILAKIIERCIGIGWFRYYHLLVSKTMHFFIISYPKLCFRVVLEPFPEAESAPIRSAVKFYFDIDIRKISNFFKKYFFRSIKKKLIQIKWPFSRGRRVPPILLQTRVHVLESLGIPGIRDICPYYPKALN